MLVKRFITREKLIIQIFGLTFLGDKNIKIWVAIDSTIHDQNRQMHINRYIVCFIKQCWTTPTGVFSPNITTQDTGTDSRRSYSGRWYGNRWSYTRCVSEEKTLILIWQQMNFIMLYINTFYITSGWFWLSYTPNAPLCTFNDLVFFRFTFSPLASSPIFVYPILQSPLALLMSNVLIHDTLPIILYYASPSFNGYICSQVALLDLTVPLPRTFRFHWGTSF